MKKPAMSCFIACVLAAAQTAPNLSFDVASVKLNKSNDPPNSNFPLGPGDVYVSNGGLFSATGLPLVTYLFFAYKIIGNQGQSLLPQLPSWATADRFDIEARAEGNPGKDQMRMMMRSLLADRFKLKMHTESRELPVLALVLAKPGKTGPQLQPHPADVPCPTSATPQSGPAAPGAISPSSTVAGGFPALCNGIFGMPPTTPGRARMGARNITLKFLADSLSAGANLGRPMIDSTGLSGTFDVLLEYTPELNGPLPPGTNFQPDASGPTLEQALREQLGIKLESTKTAMDVLVIDHVEHPSEN
jgi:uncharacterized protein (TIGR03435 family)